MTDNNQKVALLTNTEKYVFIERWELYDLAVSKLVISVDSEPTQEQIENKIDEISDNALFGYEELLVIEKD